MVLRVEDAHELTAFSPLCIFCLVTCPFDNRVESVKKVLNEQRRALSTGFAIRQQSQKVTCTLFSKLGVGNRVQAARQAQELGLLKEEV